MNLDLQTARRRIAAAEATAALFLLPPYEAAADRQAAQDEAAGHVLQAVELLIRAGHDDLAMKALELLQKAEAA